MDTKILINGAFVDGTETPETILNPRTGETILELPEASLEQVDAAANAAAEAFTAGRARPRPNGRRRFCRSPTGSRPRPRPSGGSRR
jgi:aminobutyraldehyde dehydrogenase